MSHSLVFLLDVDNTLLDNDRFRRDLDSRLLRAFGEIERGRYWKLFEELRKQLSYADYLGALQKLRFGLEDSFELLQMSSFLLDYPFDERAYPRALEAVAHLDTLGLTVILSDGDMVFQPRKIQRSGIWAAVGGRVVIDVHKETALDSMQQRYPAGHYVMIDDKPTILAAIKRALKTKVTTVFVHQGHYADDPDNEALEPKPDMSVMRIADLLGLGLTDFLASSPMGAASASPPAATHG